MTDGGVGTGVLTPIEVLVPAGEAEAAADAARGVDGVQLAVVGTTPGRPGRRRRPARPTPPWTATPQLWSTTSERQSNGAVDGEVGITGLGPTIEDYFSAVYDKFPYVLALIALITFMLLVRTFRSVLLPLKAVLLNLISLGGRLRRRSCSSGSWATASDAIFNVAPTGAINFWLPVVIFAFLFGLSMDYEVFILARMREEYDRTGDTNMAVITGIGRTGRLVTSAALILFFAFSALASVARNRHQGARHRAGRRHPHRRHDRPRPAGARAGQHLRPMELVAARLARPHPVRGALPADPDARAPRT